MAFLLSMPFGVVSSAAPVKPSHPPGNNGTVKVDGLPFDTHIDNEPHPGCTFRITFFNYEQSPALWATATFALIPPTGGGTTTFGPVFIGADPIGGAKDFDGALQPDLGSFLTGSGLAPQPQQGYHIKLTVVAPGSIGSDVKHKVFWVQCAASPGPTPSPTVLPSQTTSPSPSVMPTVTSTPTVSPTPVVSPTTTPAGTPPSVKPVVLAEHLHRPTVAPAQLTTLPRTGVSAWMVFGIGIALTAAGMLAFRYGAPRHSED